MMCRSGMLRFMTRTMIDLDDDLVARAAKELGTATKKDTVHAALRAALRSSATRSLMDRMAENADGVDDEALVNEMWRRGEGELPS
jgi:Arc/MetJ family transcription regulator